MEFDVYEDGNYVDPIKAKALFIIQFHYDCEVIVVDQVGIHPVVGDIVQANICVPDQEITDGIYNDVIEMLNTDGIV